MESLEYNDLLPKTLWQYTSGAGVTGIITGRQLWGTHHLYLNDLTEFRYAATVINSVLEEAMYEDTTPQIRDELHRLQGLVADAHSDVTPDIFVCSFGARHDNLNLWTRYTRAGDAYSIGIDGMYRWARGYQSWQLRRCFYKPEEQRVFIHYAIADRLKQLQAGAPWQHTFVELAYDIGWLAPLLKDQCWEDEHEWRFIRYPHELVRFPEPDPPAVPVRPGKDGARIPYLPFPLDDNPLSLRVTIGPGPTPPLTAADLVEMGKKHGVDVLPEASRLPIRDW